MENFGKFMIILLAKIMTTIINGFVLAKLWMWFIVPTFKTQPLRIIEAIGIIFLINSLFDKKAKNDDSFWKSFIKNFIYIIVIAVFTLLSGWIATLFM